MWIVKVALQRPYTFIMLAVLIVLMGGYAILKTATDIFPNIKIPIAAVIWRYNGILPEEIANRIVLFSERVAQTTVNDVEHTKSQSVNGTAVVKYFFQPDADQDLSMSQITAVSQVQLAFSPPGTTPPFVLSYSASSVPILQLALSSETLPESQIYDLANTVVRTQLATVAGASIPYPFGGKQRQVQVDLDPQALRARGLSGNDVVAAIGAQNLILPAGTQKIGPLEYFVKLNASPAQIEELNDLPIRARNGSVTTIRDVAHVRDTLPDQHGAARWPASRADEREPAGLHHRHHQRHRQKHAELAHLRGVEDRTERSIDLRAFPLRGRARSGDRQHDRPADSLVLGQLAQHLIITISIPLSILVIYCL
jgi:multidrug efflux pump subunit AcrB